MADAARTKMLRQEREWRAQDALRTLQAADQIKRDQALMRDARSLAKKQVQALSKVARSK